MSDLTERQRRFVEEYMVDANATAAYIRAGYSPKGAEGHAARLVGNGRVKEAIAAARAKRSKSVEIRAEHVLSILVKEAKGEGKDTSSAARIRAAELIGKHIGMFVERHEHTVKSPDRMTREELLAALGEDEADQPATRH